MTNKDRDQQPIDERQRDGLTEASQPTVTEMGTHTAETETEGGGIPQGATTADIDELSQPSDRHGGTQQ